VGPPILMFNRDIRQLEDLPISNHVARVCGAALDISHSFFDPALEQPIAADHFLGLNEPGPSDHARLPLATEKRAPVVFCG